MKRFMGVCFLATHIPLAKTQLHAPSYIQQAWNMASGQAATPSTTLSKWGANPHWTASQVCPRHCTAGKMLSQVLLRLPLFTVEAVSDIILIFQIGSRLAYL